MSSKKLDILYVISIHTHGKGGHYHSLNHISNSLSDHYNVGIISIGHDQSPVLENNPHFLGHYYFNGLNYFNFKRKIRALVSEYRPTYTNCFDWSATIMMGMIIKRESSIVCFTKCGGPNVDYGYFQNMVLFSQENLNWYKSKPEFLNSNLALISNRVKKLKVNTEAVITKNAETTFIAISRIGLAYTPNLCKAIELISKLSPEFDVELIIIGTVESEQNLKELTDLVNDDIKIRILTSEDYTKEASRFLPNADITINSGRGVMESCSLGLPSLCYAKNLDIPVLLDEVSFDTLFENNFSPRSFVLNDDEDDQLSKIKTIIKDKESKKKASSFSKEAFEEHFNLENALSKYNSFYENAKSWDFKSVKYLIWIFRSFYKSYRRI